MSRHFHIHSPSIISTLLTNFTDFCDSQDTGVFQQKTVSKTIQEAMATDPFIMVGMMKRNLSGMAPQLLMGMVVNFFFNGFVMGKVPFSLSPRFKPMLQVRMLLEDTHCMVTHSACLAHAASHSACNLHSACN